MPTPSAGLEIGEALLSPPERADLDSVAQHFANLAGGPRGMAELLYHEFHHADSGSPIRARVMEMVFRSLAKLEGKAGDDLTLMEDKDLERLLELKLRNLNGRAEAASPGNPAAADPREEAKARAAEEATGADQGQDGDPIVADRPGSAASGDVGSGSQ